MLDTFEFHPNSEEELADIVRETAQPLHIQGGGTRSTWVPEGAAALSTSRLTGITLYDPGALTLVAQSGTPLAEIEAALANEKQRLAFEPMDHRGLLGTKGAPTIGGLVAANVSGPRRVQVGACRDHLLGVRFVDGRGSILKNGGRVMKNVTGYDLAKLMAGSNGTLGVLSEVSLKVLPQVESVSVVLLNGLSNEAALQEMSKAMRSPFEVSGAAHTPSGIDGHPVTMLRVEGFSESVKYRANALCEMFHNVVDVLVETDPEKTKAGWNWVKNVEGFHDEKGDVWRISCIPSEATKLANAAGGKVLFDWAGGLIWALVAEGTDLRQKLDDFEGHATLVRAGREAGNAISRFHPAPPLLAKLSEGVRAQFDPRGILNTGLMRH